jgi:hypothetical protein
VVPFGRGLAQRLPSDPRAELVGTEEVAERDTFGGALRGFGAQRGEGGVRRELAGVDGLEEEPQVLASRLEHAVGRDRRRQRPVCRDLRGDGVDHPAGDRLRASLQPAHECLRHHPPFVIHHNLPAETGRFAHRESCPERKVDGLARTD